MKILLFLVAIGISLYADNIQMKHKECYSGDAEACNFIGYTFREQKSIPISIKYFNKACNL